MKLYMHPVSTTSRPVVQFITDNDIAVELVPVDILKGEHAKGKAEGREVRGVSDHNFIRSIYFRDPNGYVIELTAKVAGHESAMDPSKNHARDILAKWQAAKQPAARKASVAAS
jgi:hypothetical protein